MLTEIPVIVASLKDAQGRCGRGEAAGVSYDGETPASMAAQLHGLRARLHDDVTPADLMA
ncbi:hypothetical protein [Roseateles toxinivorans]|uniref:hypothetical protein n=1 Tax=Roseateles toxinivorans TaxID=270368 RepID=UPI001060D25C|nr:hypothetical protein [Roseateles toxinivorans]